ncbi:hypothetical protein GCM10009133_38610 [Cocleimonas flava]|uniref:Type IV pilin accessory protein n=1 Tax=Cocleimonas flava TaxID=634765 RepID=A0A4R1F4L4_9GAMM|nr:hypothetical protein [Cocleimonas flava]TCJ88300.1 hypothetical protein EV695_0142 [Cocleimonas flava]
MRVKVALRNLLISQLIIGIFLIFAYFVWFPHSYSTLGGFYKTAFMIVFVDIILGPLLVFIVYKKDKKYLNFDINVLLGIQLAAFIYGAYALYLKHPVYNVFVENSFKLINVSFYKPTNTYFENLHNFFYSRPKIAYTELPKDQTERTRFMIGVDLFGEPDIYQRRDLYQPHYQALNKILDRQLNPTLLFSSNETRTKLNKFITKYGGDLSDYAFFPISGNNKKEAVFAMNKKNGDAVGIIDMSPKLKLAKLNNTTLD